MIEILNEFGNVVQIMLGSAGLLVAYATLKSSSTERKQDELLNQLRETQYDNSRLMEKQIELLEQISRIEDRGLPRPSEKNTD